MKTLLRALFVTIATFLTVRMGLDLFGFTTPIASTLFSVATGAVLMFMYYVAMSFAFTKVLVIALPAKEKAEENKSDEQV